MFLKKYIKITLFFLIYMYLCILDEAILKKNLKDARESGGIPELFLQL